MSDNKNDIVVSESKIIISDNESNDSSVVFIEPPTAVISDSDDEIEKKILSENHPQNQVKEFSGMKYKSAKQCNEQPIVVIGDTDDDVETKDLENRPTSDAFFGNRLMKRKRYFDEVVSCGEGDFKNFHELNSLNENIESPVGENTEEARPFYISPGPAVEHCKSLKRKISTVSNGMENISKKSKCMKIGTMKNRQIIDVFNDLTHTNNARQQVSDESDADTHSTATARDNMTLNGNEVYVVVRQFPDEYQSAITDEKALNQTHSTHSTQTTTPLLHWNKCNNTQTNTHYAVYIYGNKKIEGGFGWNDEMRNFYNKTWNGENFSLDKILSEMDPSKHLWRICNEDRFNKPVSRRGRKMKCNNCFDFGHNRSNCKKPKKPLICYMCSNIGHRALHCPDSICLRCGRKTQTFTSKCKVCAFQENIVCGNCEIPGHTSNNCPDNWRRYHSTIESNATPKPIIFYNPIKNCCVCGARDHYPENCPSGKEFEGYPLMLSVVKSHQKLYDDIPIKSSHRPSISFKLLYNPCQNYKFKFSENINEKGWYGRFLKAVGMPLKSGSNTSPPSDGLQPGQGNLKSELPYNISNESSKHLVVEGSQKKNNTKQRNKENSGEIEYDRMENECTTTNCPLDISNANYSKAKKEQEALKHKSQCGQKFVSTDTTTRQAEYVTKRIPFPAGHLPDYIPLKISENTTACQNYSNIGNFKSANFGNANVEDIVAATEDDNMNKHSNDSLASVAHFQSEAKIYLLHSHTKYLLSPEGQAFLSEISQIYGIKARLQWTSVGHVLFISGSQISQEKFHQQLLEKCNNLSKNGKPLQSQNNPNIPKRAQVLIDFLKENIKQLYTDLGDVNVLYKRLNYLEKQQSKCANKSADKNRRALNMILFGKAGLFGGDVHLDKLLQYIKILINDYPGDVAVPFKFRNEIARHYKIIFTSHDNGDYANIIHEYNKLSCKNRLAALNVDSLLSELPNYKSSPS